MTPLIVNSKEFKQNIYKYLKPGIYIITNHDEPKYKVEVVDISTHVTIPHTYVATEQEVPALKL